MLYGLFVRPSAPEKTDRMLLIPGQLGGDDIFGDHNRRTWAWLQLIGALCGEIELLDPLG
jgi:hypothetical protein